MKKVKFAFFLCCFSLLSSAYKPIDNKAISNDDVSVFFSQIENGTYTEDLQEIKEMKQLVFDELNEDELEKYVNRESDDWYFVPQIIDLEICPGYGYACKLAQLMATYNPIFEEVRKGRDRPDFVLIFSRD